MAAVEHIDDGTVGAQGRPQPHALRRHAIDDAQVYASRGFLSPTQTIAGLLYAPEGRVRLQGYELFKALRGHTTHEKTFDVPVVPKLSVMPPSSSLTNFTCSALE